MATRPALVCLAIGIVLLGTGTYWGLVKAPAESYQGEVQRIMYIHVPTAWTTLIALTVAFIAALAFLFTNEWKWDIRSESAAEVGVLLALLLCIQGSIWAKPTWGVWWDWDPRLTTTAILLFAFAGILSLRKFVTEPRRRATWAAVATVIAYIDVPIVYFSVKWWNSLHQQQSTIKTISPSFRVPLLLNALGMLLVVIALIMLRGRLAAARLREELAPPLADTPTKGQAIFQGESLWTA